MTRFLSVDDVMLIHDLEIPVPLLDRAGLASAVGQPPQTFGGEFLYPTLFLQAAILMRGICQAHAFFDGNKRTAWLSGLLFLRINGVVVDRVHDSDGLDLMRRIATRAVDVDDISAWLGERT